MKLTDAEIDEIATQPCSATGRRKKELAIEVKELREALKAAKAAGAYEAGLASGGAIAEIVATNTRLRDEIARLNADLARARTGLDGQEIEALRRENTRLTADRDYFKAAYSRKLVDEKQALEAAQAALAANTPLLARVAALEKQLSEARTVPATYCHGCGRALHAEEVHCDDCADDLREDEGWTIPPESQPAPQAGPAPASDNRSICKPGDTFP